jgi:hypothetical protein
MIRTPQLGLSRCGPPVGATRANSGIAPRNRGLNKILSKRQRVEIGFNTTTVDAALQRFLFIVFLQLDPTANSPCTSNKKI